MTFKHLHIIIVIIHPFQASLFFVQVTSFELNKSAYMKSRFQNQEFFLPGLYTEIQMPGLDQNQNKVPQKEEVK